MSNRKINSLKKNIYYIAKYYIHNIHNIISFQFSNRKYFQFVKKF